MKIPGRHRGLHALAGAYALDALDRAEQTRFERHLTSCATCLNNVRAFTGIAAELAQAVAVLPPPIVKERVMTDAAALSQARVMVDEIIALLSAPDARVATSATSAGGSATVVASLDSAAMVFTGTGLPPLPAHSVYELWFIGPDGARPAGLVPPVSAPVLVPGFRAGDSIGITVEPAGGSSAPTTSPIAVLAPRR